MSNNMSGSIQSNMTSNLFNDVDIPSPLHPWHQALSTLFAATVSYIHLYSQCRANLFSSVPWIKQGFLTKLFLNLANLRSLTPVPSVSQQNLNIGSAVAWVRTTYNYHLPSSNSPSIITHMPHAPDSPNQQPVIQVYDNTLTTLTHTHTHIHTNTHTHNHTLKLINPFHPHCWLHPVLVQLPSSLVQEYPLLEYTNFLLFSNLPLVRRLSTTYHPTDLLPQRCRILCWTGTVKANPSKSDVNVPAAYLLLVYVYFITRKNKTL